MLLALLIAAVGGSPDPLIGYIASYGAAAPLLVVFYRQAQQARDEVASAKDEAAKAVAKAEAERDAAVQKAATAAAEERARSEALTERLLQQQAAALPVLTEAVAAIKATAAGRG